MTVRELHTGTFYSRVPVCIASKLGFRSKSVVCALAVTVFGLPPWAIFHYGFFYSFDLAGGSPTLSITVYLASLWLWVGPLLICVWELRYAEFIEELMDRGSEVKESRLESAPLCAIHRRGSAWYGLFYGGFALYFFYIAQDELRTYLDLRDHGLILALTLLTLFAGAFSCGYGISGVVQTLMIFSRLQAFRSWILFHRDGCGGLKCFSRFAIMTTTIFAAGSIVLPATVGVARMVGDNSVWVVYVVVVGYTSLIAISFLYPFARIRGLAETAQGEELHFVRKSLFNVYQAMRHLERLEGTAGQGNVPSMDSLAKFDRLVTVENRLKAESVGGFPQQTLVKLITAASAPILFALLERILDKYIQ